MAKYLLSEDFWRDFLDNYWEKKPTALQRLFETPITSADELFETVLGLSSTEAIPHRLWVSNKGQPRTRNDFSALPYEVHGPKPGDQSFDGFFNRMHKEFYNSQIGINIHNLERANPALWFRFREFINPLNRVSGELPTGRWDIDTFFGTYKISPLGIHNDNASVFAMGIKGKRTYYAWPEDYFKEGDDALHTLDFSVIEPHLDNAVRMDLGPGDVLYWPSSNWHLIVSDGDPSIAVSISAYFGEDLSKIISSQIGELIAEQLGDNNSHEVFKFTENPAELPQPLLDTHQLLLQAAQSGFVSDRLQQNWLAFSTADGLHPVMGNTEKELTPEEQIYGNPRYPIAFAKSSSGGHFLAANGLVFLVMDLEDTEIQDMLKQLNSGDRFTIADFVKQHTQGDLPEETVLDILALLYRCRAFQIAK